MNEREKISIGLAWYRPEQWSLLRALAADPEALEHTHAEWLACAIKGIEDLRKQGIMARKIEVDVQELATWCQAHERPLDGGARAVFVAEKVRTANL
jgi:hypothetical protein